MSRRVRHIWRQFGLSFLLAAWFYILSEHILLGAVVNEVLLEQHAANTRIPRSKHQAA